MSRVCYACGDPAKKKHQGKPLCTECYDELANGAIKNMNVNFFGGPGSHGVMEENGPYQENAIRDLEESR